MWVFLFLHESCVYSELFIGLLFDWITLSHDTDGTRRTPDTRYDELILAMVTWWLVFCHVMLLTPSHASLFVIAVNEENEMKRKSVKIPWEMTFCHLKCHLSHEISQSAFGTDNINQSLVGLSRAVKVQTCYFLINLIICCLPGDRALKWRFRQKQTSILIFQHKFRFWFSCSSFFSAAAEVPVVAALLCSHDPKFK